MIKLTQGQKTAIVSEVRRKISDKRKVEFEKFCSSTTVPSSLAELSKNYEEYSHLNSQRQALLLKMNNLKDLTYEFLENHPELKKYDFPCIWGNLNSEDITNFYLKKKFDSENVEPNVEHLLELELLKGVFDLESFLSKF